MVDLADVSPGDVITSARANLVNDYLEDGTHEINTLSLEIGGSEVITSTRKLTNVLDVEITSGNKLVLDGASGDSYLIYDNSKIELWVDGTKKAEWG